MGNHAEDEGSGSQKKDPNPYWQVQNSVETGVPLPDFALLGILELSVITHGGEFLRGTGWQSTVALKCIAKGVPNL
jgi:hypothetical protein